MASKACCNPNCKYSDPPGALLDEHSFYKAKKNWDGLDTYCKHCRADKNIECRERNPERVSNWAFGTRGRRPATIEKAKNPRKFGWQKEDDAAMAKRVVDKRHRRRTEVERKKISRALKGNSNAVGNKGNSGRVMSAEAKQAKRLAMLEYHSKKRRREGKVARTVSVPRKSKVAAPRVFDYKTNTWVNDPGTRRTGSERI